jgi:hypothetical protein
MIDVLAKSTFCETVMISFTLNGPKPKSRSQRGTAQKVMKHIDVRSFPYAGITQIRFKGCNLRLKSHPGLKLLNPP